MAARQAIDNVGSALDLGQASEARRSFRGTRDALARLSGKLIGAARGATGALVATVAGVRELVGRAILGARRDHTAEAGLAEGCARLGRRRPAARRPRDGVSLGDLAANGFFGGRYALLQIRRGIRDRRRRDKEEGRSRSPSRV